MEDLRRWLSEVEALGELKTVNGADRDLEIGAIAMLNWTRPKAPALVFDKIQGYPEGFRVLTASTSTASRVAITFHLTGVSSNRDVVNLLAQRLNSWIAHSAKFPPLKVSHRPVLENVQDGQNVNLLRFPAPKWHEDDGGRFIGTGSAVITKDPDTGEVNMGTYRMHLHDERTTGLLIMPWHHGAVHAAKYHARGQRCPALASFGHHPLIFRTASVEVPPGVEMGMVGAIQGSPMAVIEEEITGLPLPAYGEIVAAGWVYPGRVREEGPFGEWTGYYVREAAPAPVFEVERVYYRNEPVLLGSPPDRAPSDSSYFLAVLRSALLYNFLVECGVPDVRGVWVSEEGGTQLIIVSIKQRYAGHAKQVAVLASQSAVGTNQGRYVVVVDEDIEPSNVQEVLWAVCTRSDPEKDIDILRRIRSNPLDPVVRRPAEAYFGSVALIDACKPYEWINEFPREIRISPELQARVAAKWHGVLGG